MSGEIEIQEGVAGEAAELIVQPAKAEGWLAFYSMATGGPYYWMCAYPMYPAGVWADQHRCPNPLFLTREFAIDECRKHLPNGGTIKLVKVAL